MQSWQLVANDGEFIRNVCGLRMIWARHRDVVRIAVESIKESLDPRVEVSVRLADGTYITGRHPSKTVIARFLGARKMRNIPCEWFGEHVLCGSLSSHQSLP